MNETPEQHARYQDFATLLAQWIEDNLETRLDIDAVAAKAGYSKWHLQRIFKSVTGHSLATYMRLRRLSAAAQALRSSHDTILSVAMRYNFDSQQSFSRTFKKYFGQSPNSYRRQREFDDVRLLPPYRQAPPLTAQERPARALPLPGYAAQAERCAFGGTQM